MGNPPAALAKATVWARTTTPASFMNLQPREVRFQNGVSIGDDGTEYVLFRTLQPSQAPLFADYTVRYQFWLSDPQDAQGNPVDHADAVRFDDLARIDIYTTVGQPKDPWNENEQSRPWVSALAFTCYPCGARFQATSDAIADRITEHLNRGHDMQYDHVIGKGRFTQKAVVQQTGVVVAVHIDLTAYVTRRQTVVDCYDQAGAVSALANLAHRDAATAIWHNRFGYINTVTAVGGTSTNHPFYLDPSYIARPIVGADDTFPDANFDGLYDRSFFRDHVYVVIRSSSLITDATIGPVTSAQALDAAAYVNTYQDTSTDPEKKIKEVRGRVLVDVDVEGSGSRIKTVISR